jgi:hypothetical protein
VTFKKGISGNPNGRPKRGPNLLEIEELARHAGPKAIERLQFWLKSEDGRISVAAAKVLLDRGFGTPQQTITATVTDERTVIRAPEPAQTAEEWRASLPKPH